MTKKILLGLFAVLTVLYAVAVVTMNNVLGDIISPFLTLMAFGFVLYGFVRKDDSKPYKAAGLLFALAIFSWFLCDIGWGISTLILNVNPDENLWISYGYSLTNLFLVLSLAISGSMEIKRLNKIQLLLDGMIISICMMVLVWVFIFEQDMERARILQTDTVSFFSIVLDCIIFVWTSIWYFSTRTQKIPLFLRFSATAGILFVITDLAYYYVYFYKTYIPNSWIDGAYALSFILMGISGYIKATMKPLTQAVPDTSDIPRRFEATIRKEFILIGVPIFVLIFKRQEIEYFLILFVAMLVYFVLLQYTEKNLFQAEMLKLEKKHVSELERKVEERTREMVRVMNTDVVTGLYNRRYLEDYLGKLCASLGENESVQLLYIDINKYKSVKALYGKSVAESLLKEVGRRLNELAFETGDTELVACYSEDDYIVLKKNSSCEETMALSHKIINHCSAKYLIDYHNIVVTLNIGLSCYPHNSKAYDELIKNADAAMLHARKQGYNKIAQFTDEIGTDANTRSRIDMMLKQVQFDDEFCLYFQPQVTCKDGQIIGTEALIRWFTKDGEYIPPNLFIPITEESGQIISLGYWIVEQAAKQLANWRAACSNPPRMAINVSVKQLNEPDFLARFTEILRRYDIPPESFEVEVTENVPIEGNTEIMKNLTSLREMGILIAIDDFGTGYSSLYYLKNLPMDRIKIAKELIDNIESDTYSRAIIQMVIEIAKSNGIKVIAEGVETKEQWECLKRLDCDEIQGYYFSKPLPPEEVRVLWLTNKETTVSFY